MFDCRGQAMRPIAGEVHRVHDVVGIGFGPSGLALAIAIEEHNATLPAEQAISAHFFERQPRFGWHRGMLLPGTTMQVSFLKDLATLRNPHSTFSFVSYLHAADRLVDFINGKSLFPSRVEFHGYLEWVAERLEHLVSYDSEVVEIRPVLDGGTVAYLDVVTRGAAGAPTVTRTRNVVVATGLTPKLPQGIERSERVWHTSELLPRLATFEAERPRRFVVVGAGQSAAETTEHLHDRFADAEICSVFSRYGYSPADDSPFANQIFDPAAVDTFYAAGDQTRRMLVDYHANTNYSVVDLELIQELYRRAYQEKVRGNERLRWINVSRVTDVHDTGDDVVAVIRSLIDGETSMLRADAIVFATGYEPADARVLLGELDALCLHDTDGALALRRDYRVETAPAVAAGIYVQGASQHAHGLSSSLLSNTAVRAGEILESLLADRSPVTAPVASDLAVASHV
jgi:L-ornithine N5-oxygenase